MRSSLENLNIAIAHDWLTCMAGADRALLSIAEIFPKAAIYTSVYDKKKTKPFAKYKVIPSFLQHIPFMKSKREMLVPFAPFVFENFDLSKYDLVISSASMPSKGVITKPETAHICYCHTPSRYLWQPEIDPRASRGLFSGLRKRTAHKLRIWDIAASSRPDFYIANSKNVAKRIKKYYKKDSIVIYPPVEIDRFSIAKPEDVKDYYLFVSRLVGYKKCDLAVDAFNKLGLPLKIIGQGPEKSRLQAKANDNIEFLGFLSDDEINKYYREAKAFIFAAEEDFGIVPVEAMATGRPIIAYEYGGATETVVAGVTGEFFSEQTVESLSTAVKNFDASKYDSNQIRRHALKFSKERFQKEFFETIERLYNEYKA